MAGRAARTTIATLAAVACVAAGRAAAGRVGAAGPHGVDPQVAPGVAPGDAPGPLTLYPRRPGAKAGEVELRAGVAAPLPYGGVISPGPVSVVGRAAMPPGAARDVSALAEGFAPRVEDADALAHVTVTVADAAFVPAVRCVLVHARDGAVASPYVAAVPPSPDAGRTRPATTEMWFPIGDRRGRFYLTCAAVVLPGATRVVWGVDV